MRTAHRNKHFLQVVSVVVVTAIGGCTSQTKVGENLSSAVPSSTAKQTKPTRQAQVRDVEFSPDNSKFVVAKRLDVGNQYSGKIEVWDPRAKREISSWNILQAPRAIGFLDTNRLAVNGSDSLQIWDLRTAKLLKTVARSGTAFTVSPKRNLVATDTEIWRVRDWKKSAKLQSQWMPYIRAAAFSPDETILVTGAWDVSRGIEGFDAKTGRHLWMAGGDVEGNIEFSPDGHSVGIITTTGIVLLNPKTGRVIRHIGHSGGGEFRFLSDQILVQKNVDESRNNQQSRVTYAVSTGKTLTTVPALENEVITPDESLRFRFVGAEKSVQFE